MSKITYESFATLFPFARNGSLDLTQELLSLMQPFSCSAGTTLYFDGDSCTQIAFLISGEIRVYKIGETGRERKGVASLLDSSSVHSPVKISLDYT